MKITDAPLGVISESSKAYTNLYFPEISPCSIDYVAKLICSDTNCCDS